ncbi:DUF937 domain-containing protein [Mycobacterium botniense]|jgi:hypothetical protein|uniref:DUF937 domain-containing protein n=1 Tax=Mycobacterium botniense TaxID=84962 RepID=A0A7I9XZW7_9MYCO|nr:DUF937 domain-containing protein [Mycobacterium botniense]GFG75310.1 hypothetical protein MBOT_26750 [Mycobacterium botniense]
MAGLDELFVRIPTADIARKLDVGEGEVDSAVRTLVPMLVGGIHQKVQDPNHAAEIESAVTGRAVLPDGAISIDHAEQPAPHTAFARIFGGNDTGQVAAALWGVGADNSDLSQKLLPILMPIVLEYLGEQLSEKSASTGQKPAKGALNDVLDDILGGASGGRNRSVGGIVGDALGSRVGRALGDILSGLLGRRR